MFAPELIVKQLVDKIIDKTNSQISEIDSSHFLFGIVTNDSPLRIRIFNRNDLEIDERVIEIHPFCREFKIEIEEHETNITNGHSHIIPSKEVILWENLKINERVKMLKLSGDTKYYVLERGEGIDS